MISRSTIIDALHTRLEVHPHVLAAWLEGADATHTVDAFSDIDFCCSVEPGHLDDTEAIARQALGGLGAVDQDFLKQNRCDRRQIVFHLEGTSPYALIDFNLYCGCGSTFFLNDQIEQPLVFFDRSGIIQFIEPREEFSESFRRDQIRRLEEIVAEKSRVEKYILRGHFIEAWGYYQRYILEPLIEALRLKYTPLHPDYSIIHISHHLPKKIVKRMERFYQIESLEDLGIQLKEAVDMFELAIAEVGETDNHL